MTYEGWTPFVDIPKCTKLWNPHTVCMGLEFRMERLGFRAVLNPGAVLYLKNRMDLSTTTVTAVF